VKVDHIGIAVRALDKAAEFYRDSLGLEISAMEEVAGEGVRVAFLPVDGGRIELLEPLSEESPVGRFLSKRGEGIHHVCLQVEDLDAVVSSLQARGASVIEPAIRTGAGGNRIAFVHPRSTHGLLLELKEVEKSTAHKKTIGPGSVVVVYLNDPAAKIWGVLTSMDQTGVGIEGIDLKSFDQWTRGIMSGDLGPRDVSIAFYPLTRVVKILLDRGTDTAPSLQAQFAERTGKTITEFMSE
jgi:methylmalonyl-CoA epimerase